MPEQASFPAYTPAGCPPSSDTPQVLECARSAYFAFFSPAQQAEAPAALVLQQLLCLLKKRRLPTSQLAAEAEQAEPEALAGAE